MCTCLIHTYNTLERQRFYDHDSAFTASNQQFKGHATHLMELSGPQHCRNGALPSCLSRTSLALAHACNEEASFVLHTSVVLTSMVLCHVLQHTTETRALATKRCDNYVEDNFEYESNCCNCFESLSVPQVYTITEMLWKLVVSFTA
jgi:hypothetical protein